MYTPILKGKQFELAALKELIGHIPAQNVHPIIEPVNSSLGQLTATVIELAKNSVVPWVIINPDQGNYSNSHNTNIASALNIEISKKTTNQFIYTPCIRIKNEKDYNAISLLGKTPTPFVAYIEEDITLALLKILKTASVVVLNPDKNHLSIWNQLTSVVLYHDGFAKQTRNLDYPQESFYSRLHLDYRNFPNAIGFGDYTILSERFSEGGGPAYVVTLHLSYLDSARQQQMFIRHFSSFTDTLSQSDPGGKFLEALDLLITYVNNNTTKFLMTQGLQDFYKYHRLQHYPGLGIAKKMSIKHHIQTLSNH